MSIDTDALAAGHDLPLGPPVIFTLARQGSMRFGPQHTGGMTMPKHQIFATAFARVYPLYVQKAERKSRTKEEVDQIICWLTGYDKAGLHRQIDTPSRQAD